MSHYDIEKEILLIRHHLERLGKKNDATGNYECSFGVFFKDPVTEQVFESLVGSLKAARKRRTIDFKGEMLLSPMHDATMLTLLQPLTDDERASL